MISVKNLVKNFNAVTAVNDLSFDVNPGEIFGLLGPNGAGKSTTIRMLLSILLPESGTITYDGNLFENSLRNKIGYLPEERGIYQKNKILDVITYFASLKDIPVSQSIKLGMEWLARFDLQNYAKKQVCELSKGNQQKIQFIISILHNPKYIILDEPFSGLDPLNQILLKEIMMELKQSGKIIIFSTHQMETAEKLCDSIVIIDKGKIVVKGNLAEVKQKFGFKTIRIEFSGNKTIFESNENITNLHLYENYLECELIDNISTKEFLNSISSEIDIRKFEIVEPSLQTIFLSSVGVVEEN